MNNHRINELIELLHNAWKKDPELSLLQFIGKLSAESGFKGNIEDISDDSLIYNLKMRESADDAEIPGLKKDYETDFKTAILRARGVIKD